MEDIAVKLKSGILFTKIGALENMRYRESPSRRAETTAFVFQEIIKPKRRWKETISLMHNDSTILEYLLHFIPAFIGLNLINTGILIGDGIERMQKIGACQNR